MRALERFRDLDKEMQAQQMLLFLTVAAEPGISMRSLEDRLELSGGAVSRNVAALSKVHRKGQDGHDLIYAEPDINDRRIHLCYLTTKGEKFLESLGVYTGD